MSGPTQFIGASCDVVYAGARISKAMMITGRHNTDNMDHLATAPMDLDKFKGKTYTQKR